MSFATTVIGTALNGIVTYDCLAMSATFPHCGLLIARIGEIKVCAKNNDSLRHGNITIYQE